MESESLEDQILARETSMLVKSSVRTECEVGDDIVGVEAEDLSNTSDPLSRGC